MSLMTKASCLVHDLESRGVVVRTMTAKAITKQLPAHLTSIFLQPPETWIPF